MQVGGWCGDRWLIDSGLKGGDRVVVNGAARLQPNCPVQIQPAAAPGTRSQPNPDETTAMISHFFINDRSSPRSFSILLWPGWPGSACCPSPNTRKLPPKVQVSANYPGASADVVSETVAAPIGQQVSGADHMLYMNSSSSSTGNMTLNVFDFGTNPDLAQVDVQNRVSVALPQLPEAVSQQGTGQESLLHHHDGDRAPPDNSLDETFIGSYLQSVCAGRAQAIPGANQASIFGLPDYAMRIWLNQTS